MEILYKRNKNGSVQQWRIEAYGDQIHIEQGQVMGKQQLYTRTATPKNVGRSNATTGDQQAFSEANSEWKSKHDSGYKTLDDVGVYDDSEYESLLAFLDTNLPKFNTDAQGQVKPMLAPTKIVDLNKLQYPVDVQPKYDGIRCLATSTSLSSRNGKSILTAPHIIQVLKDSGFKGTFDGELYIPGASFQQTVRAVKKSSPDSAKLVLRVYDIVLDNATWRNRWDKVETIVRELDSPFIVLTPTYTVTTADEARQLHDQFVLDGEEGAMIRIHNGIYQQGFRSRYLQKLKMFDDDEYPFLRFELGERGVEDLIAVCAITDVIGTSMAVKQFKAKMVGTKAHKEELYGLLEKGIIEKGSLLTVKYQGLTDDSIPRFPIGKAFRDYE